jgi:hypothetical protein
MQHGKDRKARILLWKFTKGVSSQLYDENWIPFTDLGKPTRLFNTLRQAEGFDIYSDLKYSTLELAIFPFDKISLLSMKPSDEEKTIKWNFRWERLLDDDVHATKSRRWKPGLAGGYETQIAVPSSSANEQYTLALKVPYITYSHFRSSQAYRMGRTYGDYRKGSMDQPQLREWMKIKQHTLTISFGVNNIVNILIRSSRLKCRTLREVLSSTRRRPRWKILYMIGKREHWK